MTNVQKQKQLKYLNYYKGALDGIFGSKSKEATKKFQKDYKLTVDGIFGTKTKNKSIEVWKNIQSLLNSKINSKLVIDGIVGPKTIAAIKEFQTKNGLSVDGIVGPKTTSKLNEATNTQKFIFPVNYIAITNPFGSNHKGLDLGWNRNYGGPNQDIIAVRDGTVIGVRSTYNRNDSSGGSYGNYIKIDHKDGLHSLVAHLAYGSLLVKAGDNVKQGQVLAKMGNTGHATGNHVHLEIFKNNTKVDPLPYLYVKQSQIVSSSNKYNLKYL